ncbi:MAG TPA: hypothetical protein VFC56_08915, partial [Stellaceae bacterium]|nr:hypothetical protein [Stellaceae bacterium]
MVGSRMPSPVRNSARRARLDGAVALCGAALVLSGAALAADPIAPPPASHPAAKPPHSAAADPSAPPP